MSRHEISCGLEYITAPDLQACLSEALQASYAFVVMPIVHPRFRRSHLSSGGTVGGFTRSDMILAPQDWVNRIVGKLSHYLDLDSENPIVRQRHEDCLNEELAYCRGLGIPALMLSLHSTEVNNLARNLISFMDTSHHPTLIWTYVPMVCQRTLSAQESEENDNIEVWDEPWRWWTTFHQRMNWDKRVGVVVEIPANLPPHEVLKRWLGEPIKAIVVPTSLFHNNKKGYPVLSRAHQQVVLDMIEHDAQVIVSGARRSKIEYYLQYLHRLWTKKPHVAEDPMLNYAKGWEDYLQIPLQPLADNLDTHTYNVFEKDPIKYDQYQKAIVQALTDIQKKRKEDSINNGSLSDGTDVINTDIKANEQGDIKENDKAVTVMVLGAGRGPLVRATLNAADITNSKVKVVAVEKNPCAVVVLVAQAREVWRDRDVTVIPGDMRHINLSPKADIIVSELLGSWGDNELSPECLDGAAGLLKSGGISIPREYSSYVAPISSPRLWGAAKVANLTNCQMEKNLETLWVVYMQNKHDIGEVKPVFTFEHPAKGIEDQAGKEVLDNRGLPVTDNRRSAVLSWEVKQDNVMHGFGGYFDCLLYGKEMISIVPSTHSPGMISWFPVFIPIKTPLRVHKGETITAWFWRCTNTRKVWYEWVVSVGVHTTPIHNINGRSSEMLL